MSVKQASREEFLDVIPGLLRARYAGMDRVILDKTVRARRFLDPRNPVFRFAHIEIFLSCTKDGETDGCAITIFDRRLSGEGRIGFVEFADHASGSALLAQSVAHLKREGVSVVRAPIDGTIWDRFRLCLDDSNPPFSGEPFNPALYAPVFLGSGFFPLAESESMIEPMTDELRSRYEGNERTARTSGVEIQLLHSANDPTLVEDVISLLNTSFADAPSFVSLSRDELVYSILGSLDTVESDIFVARKGAHVSGFLLGYIDGDNSGRRRYILKTTAVDPSARRAGVGGALFSRAIRTASAKGAEEVIYAIMRKDNAPIRRIAGEEKIRYRTYALYERNVRGDGPATLL
ncbi:MAG: hypothetical protein A3C93_02010 [Candidatus Lloydbacteria bacterium RIFCSPHIGHO2_02_FULL_54_17]|uniref:N-acetyltransferase domain-containing protein n=1 Tax=Candidatus Lloydbacteria bacterium RIFCSPHIGHO2_02_FULL_54_17 TaxID=1798664 RepID=A0A1G2DI37_9BACT|nr:MAG: hypothetical protein A3C93_02010 [Candidatus Lloydbacteria bacterium RIFCSPHIGHO2_02_FULL_54_17]OGZ14885.1 MAG: hypothetical protein A3H76_02615 [Candidatus Lloydbacteria bacterium RIFCSPLOWO2_02_FULL_54_12]OGZ15356.1 MAG: hypothetical protein A2948_00025 [Candidatus Lloydbacteria bacterium RIFCSPLOWO2_01_FULL_54_18]